jgi:copper chaperone CopZ
MVQITLKVDGMMCGMCESHINDAIRNTWKVTKVTSSHKSGKTVIITEQELDEDQLKAVVEKTGYRVLEVQKEPYQKKGVWPFKKA